MLRLSNSAAGSSEDDVVVMGEDVTLVSGREVVVEADAPQDAFRVNTHGEVEQDGVTRRSWRLLDQGWTLRVPQEPAGG
ncbi:hypothetical protein [Serinicoccus sp. CNJ-927]|uniref:hypothetical protein n=1 Tax=Serinicoccus sp. CNJ-927 TaxID=1904970 RepID=UPI00117A9C59|nr:hypothetical protein [Serinicoccus sp. CNJ-927]